ncbi:DUF885 domain-containing protein [Shewanella maritima]|uniref:DUF885 domain-containing protein n=1 Tax=Shewanella maritima TaxID=2520507 RepID=UPI001A9337E8|nr:DUF885 domain-containing protein [Shewanella maritima]
MIKKTLKWFGLGTVGLTAVAASFAAHEWYAEKPVFFRAFLDRELVKMAIESPETLTSLGVLESVGINGHNAHLDDVDPQKDEELFVKAAKFKRTLVQYDDSSLNTNEQFSKQIALYLLDTLAAYEPYKHHNYPANQMFGVQSGFPSFMQAQHAITSVTDANNYLSRLAEVERKFGQYVHGLQIRENKGIIPPRFVIDRVLDEMIAFVDTPADENILYTSFKEKLDKLSEIDRTEYQTLLAKAQIAINESVYPAYDLFITYFSGLRNKAGDDHGYWHLPDGDKAYDVALRFFTTTDYSAEQIHQLGLQEVARIHQEMLSLFEQEGVDTSNGYLAAMKEYSARPEFYYSDSDEGREQILKDYQKILDEIDQGLAASFNIRPKAGMEVVRIPEFKEKTSPGAYYQGPSMDGSRPGRFFANLYDIKATPKYSMRTLAYHEGIPGHHFQVAIAMELEGMPFLRRFAPFTAYTEGWALYAERLAYEQGFVKTPADNIGRLADELLRAVRLVVDTGIHAKRWTREQAIDYMASNTGRVHSDVVSEIERYIVMPGQATSYKVGMIKILELREKAKQALGDKFDIRDFHDAVLKNGPMPLDILEQVIDGYIDDARNYRLASQAEAVTL